MQLRPWQQEAYQKLKENNFTGVVKVASGKGKTVLGLHIISEVLKNNPEGKVLVVVPTINLMYQWQEECNKFFPEITTSFYYGAKKEETGQVVISVINTAAKLPFESSFDLKMLDEVHHYGASLYTSIFSIKTTYTIGLSATPERQDQGTVAIKYGVGDVVYELDHIDELNKIFSLWHIKVKFTYDEYQRYTDLQREITQLIGILTMDYGYVDLQIARRKGKSGDKRALKLLKLWAQVAQLKYKAEQKYDVAAQLAEMEKHEKVIIFSESIAFVEQLGEMIPDSLVVHSKLSKQDVINRLAQFKELKSGVLIAPRIIDEGYDVPDATVAIITSFSRTTRQMIQRDGRILRMHGKNYARRYALIIDGVDEYKYFSILAQTRMSPLAIEGKWLKFEDGFVDDEHFKEQFEAFLRDEKTTGFYGWIRKKLHYFLDEKRESELAGRVEFFDTYRDVIDEIVRENPEEFPQLVRKEEEKEDKYYFSLDISDDKKELLKKQLRQMNARLMLPNSFFNGVMRFLDSEQFTLDEDAKDYVKELTADDTPGIWPKELFAFVKQTFAKQVI